MELSFFTERKLNSGWKKETNRKLRSSRETERETRRKSVAKKRGKRRKREGIEREKIIYNIYYIK